MHLPVAGLKIKILPLLLQLHLLGEMEYQWLTVIYPPRGQQGGAHHAAGQEACLPCSGVSPNCLSFCNGCSLVMGF